MKRGQVTAFVAIGIVIIAVIVLLFFLRGYVMEATGLKEKIGTSSFVDDVEDVSDHIESCFEDSFKEAVAYQADKKITNYEKEVADYTLNRLKQCVILEQFKTVDVIPNEEPEVIVEVQEESKIVSGTLYYNLIIKKDDKQENLDEFYTSVELSERRCCVPVKVDSNCIGEEDGIFHVCGFMFTIEEGESLKKGGKCIACP